MRKIITLLALALLFDLWVWDPYLFSFQGSPAPHLFYSDLISGPNSGNSDTTYSATGGAYVSIYGNFLGSSQGASTITLNGASCLTVVSWGATWLSLPGVGTWNGGAVWQQRIVVKVGAGCTSGNIVVTTSSGTSNGIPFTVQSGTIYYVSTGGNDSNAGTFSAPFLTIPHCVQTAGTAAGNICYVENGVNANVDDGQGWSAALTFGRTWCQGTQSAPDALLAYPGATATVTGGVSGAAPTFGVRIINNDTIECGGAWVIGEMTLRGDNPATLSFGGPGWRVIANDLSNPTQTGGGSGGGATLEFAQMTHVAIFGNYIHQANTSDTNRFDQALYISTDVNWAEVAWNRVYQNGGRASFQAHSSNLGPSCGQASTPTGSTNVTLTWTSSTGGACFSGDSGANTSFFTAQPGGVVNYPTSLGGSSATGTWYTILSKTDDDHIVLTCGGSAPACPGSTSGGFFVALGLPQHDLAIHDNIFSDSAEECFITDIMNPNQGPVTIYNNLVYDCVQDGKASGGADAAFYFAQDNDYWSHGGAPLPGGTVDAYNNTIYANGVPSALPAWMGFFNPANNQTIVNSNRNTVVVTTTTNDYWDPYISTGGGSSTPCPNTNTATQCPTFVGSYDLTSGSSGSPTYPNILTTGMLNNTAPLFTNASNLDFHPQSGSPLVGAGTAISGLTYDLEGKVRPNPPSIGALEFASGGGGGSSGGAVGGKATMGGSGAFK